MLPVKCSNRDGLDQTSGYSFPVEIVAIDPVYYCLDKGTGVALVRGEDKPPRGALIDFMRGESVVKPGAMVPVCWLQLWDYRREEGEVPALFRWPDFDQWLKAWPAEEADFKAQWKRLFGLPHDDLADAAVVIWEVRTRERAAKPEEAPEI